MKVLVHTNWDNRIYLFGDRDKALKWITKELKDGLEYVKNVRVFLPIKDEIVEYKLKPSFTWEKA